MNLRKETVGKDSLNLIRFNSCTPKHYAFILLITVFEIEELSVGTA